MFTFHSFKASDPTCSRLHHRLPNSLKEKAISSLHFLKSIQLGNLYFGPFEIMLRILESEITLRFPVMTGPASG